MTRSIKAIITLSLTGSLFFAYTQLNPSEKELTESEKIEMLNQDRVTKIFDRCSDIKALSQFIKEFKPESALEFYDNSTSKKVVQVASLVEISDDFKISVIAPVAIAGNDKYELTGSPVFTVEDLKGGRFTTVRSDGSIAYTSPSIRLAPSLWERFITNGADIESLRQTEVQKDL